MQLHSRLMTKLLLLRLVGQIIAQCVLEKYVDVVHVKGDELFWTTIGQVTR